MKNIGYEKEREARGREEKGKGWPLRATFFLAPNLFMRLLRKRAAVRRFICFSIRFSIRQPFRSFVRYYAKKKKERNKS